MRLFRMGPWWFRLIVQPCATFLMLWWTFGWAAATVFAVPLVIVAVVMLRPR